MKKRINLLLIAVGLMMSFGGWSRINKRQLISSNIEALTITWESRKVNGETCIPTQLGREATEEEINNKKLHADLIKRPYSTNSSADSISFYDLGNEVSVKLPRCSTYGYAWADENYCYAPISEFSAAGVFYDEPQK